MNTILFSVDFLHKSQIMVDMNTDNSRLRTTYASHQSAPDNLFDTYRAGCKVHRRSDRYAVRRYPPDQRGRTSTLCMFRSQRKKWRGDSMENRRDLPDQVFFGRSAARFVLGNPHIGRSIRKAKRNPKLFLRHSTFHSDTLDPFSYRHMRPPG